MAMGTDAEKRKLILDRSCALFLDQGVSGLSMDRIASLQGISKKTLYRFFPNKDALVSAAIEERIAEVGAEARRLAADPDRTWIERLRAILQMVGRQIAELGESLIKDLYYRRPELWVRIDRLRNEQVLSIITHLLEEGRREGYIRKDIREGLVPLLFVNAVSSAMTPARMVSLPFPPVELFEAFVSILFGGVLTDSARRRFFSRKGII